MSSTHMVADPKLNFAREQIQVEFFREQLGRAPQAAFTARHDPLPLLEAAASITAVTVPIALEHREIVQFQSDRCPRALELGIRASSCF